MFNPFYVGIVVIQLDDRLIVDTIALAARPSADDLTAVNADPAAGRLDFHDLRKSCHVKHVHYFGVCVDHTERLFFAPFFQAEKYAQSCAGYIVKPCNVKRDALCLARQCGKCRSEFCRICGIDASLNESHCFFIICFNIDLHGFSSPFMKYRFNGLFEFVIHPQIGQATEYLDILAKQPFLPVSAVFEFIPDRFSLSFKPFCQIPNIGQLIGTDQHGTFAVAVLKCK